MKAVADLTNFLRSKQRSRVVVGFHRIGVVLAAPLLVGSIVDVGARHTLLRPSGLYIMRARGWFLDGFVSTPPRVRARPFLTP